MIEALIEINLYLLLLGGLYFTLRHFISTIWKRYLLLLMPLLALSIFIFKSLNKTFEGDYIIPTIELNAILISENVNTILQSSFVFSLLFLYGIGVIGLSVVAVFKVFKVFSFFREAKFTQTLNVYLISTDCAQSFTFFNRIHLSNSLKGKEREIVLEHELLHVKLHHTWDLILMEIYHALLWFNPMMILFKKELVYVHEYQVDRDMYLKHENQYLKHLIASSMGVNSSQLLLTSQFYNGLSLTQRTKQMKRKIKNNWKSLMLIPAFAIGLSFISFTSKSTGVPKVEIVTNDSIYERADVYPEFPGGQKAMIQFIIENIKYPKEEKEKGIEGTVYCGFVVTKTGEIVDMEILKHINEAMEEEVLRIISMMPKWTPGKKDGKMVSVKYVLPVKFALPE